MCIIENLYTLNILLILVGFLCVKTTTSYPNTRPVIVEQLLTTLMRRLVPPLWKHMILALTCLVMLKLLLLVSERFLCLFFQISSLA